MSNDLQLKRSAFKDENPAATWEDHLDVSSLDAALINLNIMLYVKPEDDPLRDIRCQRNRTRMMRVAEQDILDELDKQLKTEIDKCVLQNLLPESS